MQYMESWMDRYFLCNSDTEARGSKYKNPCQRFKIGDEQTLGPVTLR